MNIKTCGTCKELLELSEFSKNSTKKDGLQTKCKGCTKVYYKNYYRTVPKEKERILAKNIEYRDLLRTKIRELKSVPCMDCKESYPHYVMDFDHLRDKKFDIGTALSKAMRLENILLEVEKCEVVCANCHRIRTYS